MSDVMSLGHFGQQASLYTEFAQSDCSLSFSYGRVTSSGDATPSFRVTAQGAGLLRAAMSLGPH